MKSYSRYCILEIINTSVDTVEMGKNVKLGDGEPLEPMEGLVTESHACVNTVEASGKSGRM